MPELPELEVIRDVLQPRLSGKRVREANLSGRGGPIVARDLTGNGFAESLVGSTVLSVRRQGKFLIFELVEGDADSPAKDNATAANLHLAVNLKLTGRFQFTAPGSKKAGPIHVTFRFDGEDHELRYVDQKRMGQLYLTRELSRVPTFTDMGPDALHISLNEFRSRLRRFRGEIKGVLARERFVAGIGNAYADEILWKARLHPYRKRTDLSDEEIDTLYAAMREILLDSIKKVREAMGEDVHLKPREFFAVHMQGGKECPRCGGKVSEITARGRITNFCRSCQPGGLIRGM